MKWLRFLFKRKVERTAHLPKSEGYHHDAERRRLRVEHVQYYTEH